MAKCLIGCPKIYPPARRGIGGEDWRARETEYVVFLKPLNDGGVHLPKLATVALVEDHDHPLRVHRVRRVLLDEHGELLYGGDDNPRLQVLQLPLQHGSIGVAVSRALFEAVVLLHGLVVEILAIHHEDDLVDLFHAAGQPCRLKRREGFAGSGGVPDVTPTVHAAVPLVVGGEPDALYDGLRRRYLVGAHDEQQPLGGEHAVPCEHAEQGMLGQEGGRKVHQVRDDLVVHSSPKGGKLETVAGLLVGTLAPLVHLPDVRRPGGVAVILGIGTVADDEDLDILEQAGSRPEALPVIPPDLVERLLDVHAAPFQLDMHQRQAVHQDGHVIAVVTLATLRNVLVDHL